MPNENASGNTNEENLFVELKFVVDMGSSRSKYFDSFACHVELLNFYAFVCAWLLVVMTRKL